MAADLIDPKRTKVIALLYMMAEVHDGQVKIFPQVHGLYETEFAALEARKAKHNPTDYYMTSAHWRLTD